MRIDGCDVGLFASLWQPGEHMAQPSEWIDATGAASRHQTIDHWLALAPSAVSLNSHDFLPVAKTLMSRSRMLLSDRHRWQNPPGTDCCKLAGSLRCAATMAAGKMKPSQLLRKLASYPRQNDLAVALRVVGRVERTLFIIEWILDTDMQRRAEIGLNKGRGSAGTIGAYLSAGLGTHITDRRISLAEGSKGLDHLAPSRNRPLFIGSTCGSSALSSVP